jgi:hypothetical protein
MDDRARRDREGTLLRFTGVLREDHHFIHVPGWETARVIERPESGDGSYVVDLLDADGKVVSRVSPVIDFRAPEDPDASGLRLADVMVYVPMHPSARVLTFHRVTPEELEIFRADIATRPPMIRELVVDGDPPGALRLRWRSGHDREVTFTVFYWPEERTPFVVASGLRENGFEASGETLPGPTGRFAVLASDGIRSSVTIGRPLKGLSTATRVRITSPSEIGALPPDQPVDLRASVEDVSGTPVAVDELTWSIDGQQVASGQMAAAGPLDPGEHQIEVAGLRASEEVDRDVIRVTVADRNEEQDAFAERVAQLPPLEERRAETGE